MRRNSAIFAAIVFAVVVTVICSTWEIQIKETKRQEERANYYMDELLKKEIEILQLKEYIKEQENKK